MYTRSSLICEIPGYSVTSMMYYHSIRGGYNMLGRQMTKPLFCLGIQSYSRHLNAVHGKYCSQRVLSHQLINGCARPCYVCPVATVQTFASTNGCVHKNIPREFTIRKCYFHTNSRQLFQHMAKDNRDINPGSVYKLQYLRQAPLPALLLGFSGLIPFGSAALYSIVFNTCDASILFAQIAYGSTILAFLGGVRWGMTVSSESVKLNWLNLGYSVTPSLIAWLGLLLEPSLGLICLISGLSGSAIVDINLPGYPAWFKSLRFYLSSGAILSLTVSLIYCWKSSKQKTERELRMILDGK
ncbi:transmembrane protein 69-like [Glandiceps talaboti]